MEAALIGAAAELILTKLSSFAIEEIGLASSVKHDLDNLKSKVALIAALLRDAEKGPVSKQDSITQWIRDMSRAIYDADDLLEEFNYELLSKQRKPKNNYIQRTANFFSTSNPVLIRFKNGHKVREINKMLDRVAKQGTDLGLTQVALLHRDVGASSSARHDSRQTHPFGDVSKILGRDADKSKVIDMLLQSSGESSVVAIIGLGGLGKTTLAKLIYKDTHNIKFDERIWVCVSTDFNVNTILKEMVVNLGIQIKETSIPSLIKDLTKKLSKKKYLLILDDVWNTESAKWDDLTDCLFEIGADKESKILVTTRSDKVASIMHCLSRFPLEGLSPDYSWSLFRQKAFSKGAAKETTFAINSGQRIIQRCKGVPLAILTLGALLNTKKENDWPSIENSYLWDLTTNESDIMLALRLSYDHFPSSYLKQCFAYCSIFPKDSILEKDNLIQLWIAQGFIQSTPGSKVVLEDRGDDYFNILVWNSFFQDLDVDIYEKIQQTCKMHDLVHDLAQSISKSECLVMDTDNVNDTLLVRHLHLLQKKGTLPKIPNGHKLRTLFLSCEIRENTLAKLKRLRVLNFERAYFITELPKSIGKLKSLRYLNVSYTRIKELPTSILKLYNLQTIRFMKCNLLEHLPEHLGSMISLTHLCFDNYYGQKLKQMPFELRRLTSLQTLSCFVVAREKGHTIDELGSLNRLRGKLHIQDLERVRDKNEAEGAKLLWKTNLFNLILEWSREGSNVVNRDEDVLEGLQLPPNLGILKIDGFHGKKFPTWKVTTLTSLEIRRVSELSYLPKELLQLNKNLTRIYIVDCAMLKCIGTEDGDDDVGLQNLISLQEFHVEKCPKLSHIGSMHGLTSLIRMEMNGCHEIKKLPIGLGSCTSLEKLIVRCCHNLGEEGLREVKSLSCLMHIDMGGFHKELESFPLNFSTSKVQTSLKILRLLGGPKLNSLPHQLQHLTCLEDLWISGFQGSELLHDSLDHNLSSLCFLCIDRCPKLSRMGSMHGLTSLTRLSIRNCNGIANLPIGSCASLERLWVTDCGSLREEGLREVQSLNRLEHLVMGGLHSELESFPLNLSPQTLRCLKTLWLYGWPKLKSIPQQIQHLTALEWLMIHEFSGLEVLPNWLENLSSLKTLEIGECENLKYLPSVDSMRRLTSLTNLNTYQSTALEERCKKESGPEWSKISHIPWINLSTVHCSPSIFGHNFDFPNFICPFPDCILWT